MKNLTDKQLIQYIYLSQQQGFTLIELLVVVIIVGVLAAVALPNYLAQIGKARETEAKVNLGAIAHSQQVHHFETNSFYDGNDLSDFGVSSGVYYSYTGDSTADGSKAIHTAYAIDPGDSGARDFSVGIYYNASQYSQTLCIANGLDNDGTTSSVAAQTDGTCNGGTPIK